MTIRVLHEMVRHRTQCERKLSEEPSNRALVASPKSTCLSSEGTCMSPTQCEAAELLGTAKKSYFVRKHKDNYRILHEIVSGESKSYKI